MLKLEKLIDFSKGEDRYLGVDFAKGDSRCSKWERTITIFPGTRVFFSLDKPLIINGKQMYLGKGTIYRTYKATITSDDPDHVRVMDLVSFNENVIDVYVGDTHIIRPFHPDQLFRL